MLMRMGLLKLISTLFFSQIRFLSHAEYAEFWDSQSGEEFASDRFCDFCGFCVKKLRIQFFFNHFLQF